MMESGEHGRWSPGGNVPRTRSVGHPPALRSEPTPTSRSKTWRYVNSSPCPAADRSDRNSRSSIASSG